MKINRFFCSLISIFLVAILIGIPVHKDFSLHNRRNLEIAEKVARIYVEGKSKGVIWDTSSSSALVTDVIMGRYSGSAGFQGKLFDGDVPGVVNPEPSGVAELIIIDPYGCIYILDPMGILEPRK